MEIPVIFLLVLLFCAFMWGFTYREKLTKREIEYRAQDLAEVKIRKWEEERFK